ncbi:MAG: hypothetical protein ACKPKO_34130, partial [Candidatus Fonsibacter sp.]
MLSVKREMNVLLTEVQAMRESSASGLGTTEMWSLNLVKTERDREDAERRVTLLTRQLLEVRD